MERIPSGTEKAVKLFKSSDHSLVMNRPSNISIVGIICVSLLLALILLPGIAGLIEGDFGYFQRCFRRGWSDDSSTSMTEEISNIYEWSFWRVGIRDEEPLPHAIYQLIQFSHRTRTKSQVQPAERAVVPPEPLN